MEMPCLRFCVRHRSPSSRFSCSCFRQEMAARRKMLTAVEQTAAIPRMCKQSMVTIPTSLTWDVSRSAPCLFTWCAENSFRLEASKLGANECISCRSRCEYGRKASFSPTVQPRSIQKKALPHSSTLWQTKDSSMAFLSLVAR
eukprot:3060817-Pleurochrysis_carterae.AAC.1